MDFWPHDMKFAGTIGYRLHGSWNIVVDESSPVKSSIPIVLSALSLPILKFEYFGFWSTTGLDGNLLYTKPA